MRTKSLLTSLGGLLIAAVAVGLVAAPAQGQNCGEGAQYFRAHKRIGGVGTPFAIGDSVMLGAARSLARAGFEVNARCGRAMPEGLWVLKERLRRKRSPRIVLIALGSNAKVRRGDIRQALRIIGSKRVLALVIPRKHRGWNPAHDAAIIRKAGLQKPTRVLVVDWLTYSAGKKYFVSDGLHLNRRGIARYTNFLQQEIIKNETLTATHHLKSR